MFALLSFYEALGIDVTIWIVWSVTVSWWATRQPDLTVQSDGWLTRLRPWEREGRIYARLGIRRWKGKLPDLASLVGGRSKCLERRRDPQQWRLMAGETRRSERVHWIILAAVPVEALLQSGVVLVPMIGYALVANLPCIAAQRYNRGRLNALCARRMSATTSTTGPIR